MTARPMTLEEALNHEGYTINLYSQNDPLTIPIEGVGAIVVPPAVRSQLTWQRTEPPSRGDALFLDALPLFDELYRPVLLSSILDMFRTRRLAYNTPGQFRLAMRRWGNLNMTIFNQRYVSTAVNMPLDDTAATEHTLDVASDFPQSQISGSADYATSAFDHREAENGRHRSIASLLNEQRTAYLNVDAEVIAGLESLFLGIFDRGELSEPDYMPPRGSFGLGGFWNGSSWPGW